MVVSGDESQHLTIVSATVQHRGVYECQASNRFTTSRESQIFEVTVRGELENAGELWDDLPGLEFECRYLGTDWFE